jgi:hypothetical protein
MLIEDIIVESYYDFVKDDKIEDIIDHAKRDRRGYTNPIYLDWIVKNNPKYDKITMIVLAWKPTKPADLEAKKMDSEGWIIEIEAMFHNGNRTTQQENLNNIQAQRLMDNLNAAGNVERVEEDLRKWFKQKWVRFGPDGKIRGDCARGDDSEGKPKCLPQSKAYALGKKGRAKAAGRKRRQDPDAERRGPAKNVATK